MPSHTVASSDAFRRSVAGVDSQVQGVSAGTAVNVGICIGVSSCGGIRGSMPSIAVASNIRVAVVCTLENGQIQCVHIIAA